MTISPLVYPSWCVCDTLWYGLGCWTVFYPTLCLNSQLLTFSFLVTHSANYSRLEHPLLCVATPLFHNWSISWWFSSIYVVRTSGKENYIFPADLTKQKYFRKLYPCLLTCDYTSVEDFSLLWTLKKTLTLSSP